MTLPRLESSVRYLQPVALDVLGGPSHSHCSCWLEDGPFIVEDSLYGTTDGLIVNKEDAI